MDANTLAEQIDKTISPLTPDYMVSEELYRETIALSLEYADAADSLGYEGVWLRLAAERLSVPHHRMDVDHIRANLASLSYDLHGGVRARSGYESTQTWTQARNG